MISSRVWLAVLLLLTFILAACAVTQSSIETAVAQTMQISLLETAAAEAGLPTRQPEATQPLEATMDTPQPTETVAVPVEIAPEPLPASAKGIILNNGECFNFDNDQVTAPDTECDVWLAEPGLFRQMNGAQVSGYVTMTAPTRTYCVEGRYEPGDLAVQTDLYMCFISSDGRIGFVVARSYLGAIPFTGIVFDYWVFE